jgi:Glycosyltransferase family 87
MKSILQRKPADVGRAILLALALGVSMTLGIIRPDKGDVFIYRDYGEAIIAGAVPYRDFYVEYPPGALLLFVAPTLVTHAVSFATAFAGLMLIALAVAMGAGERLAQELRRRSEVVTSPPLLIGACMAVLGSVAVSRYDSVPAALTVIGLLTLIKGRYRLDGLSLGTAIAVKLYPVVALPVAVTYVVRRAGYRAAASTAAMALAVVAVAYAPFLLWSFDGARSSVAVQLSRSLEVESLGGVVFAATHRAFGITLPEQQYYYDFPYRSADIIGEISVSVGASWIAALWIMHARASGAATSLVRYGAATIAAFIAFGKVLSPQYLLWLTPLVPAVAGVRGRIATCFLGLACILTAVVFPSHWDPDLLVQLSAGPLFIYLIRDLVLVGLVAVLSCPAPGGCKRPAKIQQQGSQRKHCNIQQPDEVWRVMPTREIVRRIER